MIQQARQNQTRAFVSILNWNGTDDTITCLERIDRDQCPGVQFAVLDNGSDVDPTERFQALFPDVEIYRVPENLGFCGGHNHMIKLAKQCFLEDIGLI